MENCFSSSNITVNSAFTVHTKRLNGELMSVKKRLLTLMLYTWTDLSSVKKKKIN